MKGLLTIPFVLLLLSSLTLTTAQTEYSGLELNFSPDLQAGDEFQWETESKGIFFAELFADGSTITLSVVTTPSAATNLDDITTFVGSYFSLTSTGELADDEGLSLLFVVPTTVTQLDGTVVNPISDLWEILVSEFFDFDINGTLIGEIDGDEIQFTGTLAFGLDQDVFFSARVNLLSGVLKSLVTTISNAGTEVSRLSFSSLSGSDDENALSFNYAWGLLAIPLIALKRRKKLN